MEIEKRIKSIKTNPRPEYLLLFVAVLSFYVTLLLNLF